jgi:hypothetical protein
MTQYQCRFLARTDSDSISVSFSYKSTVMTQYQCRLVLSLSNMSKTGSDVPGGTITTGFFKTDSDEADIDSQISISGRRWRRGAHVPSVDHMHPRKYVACAVSCRMQKKRVRRVGGH